MTRDSFWESYRQLFNRRGSDWWSIVFGYPVARFVLVLLGDARWLTPTRITVVGFAVKLLAAAALLGPTPGCVLGGAILLQLSQVFDSMDGTLARMRGSSSPLGAYLDKVCDAAALIALFAAVGARAVAETGDATLALWTGAGAAAFLLGCYARWVARVLLPPAGGERIDGGSAPLPWSELLREWARGWLRIWRFQEADLYFWIAAAALFREWRLLAIVLGASQGIKALLVCAHYGWQLRRAR